MGGICCVANARKASAIRWGWVWIIDFQPGVSITSVAWLRKRYSTFLLTVYIFWWNNIFSLNQGIKHCKWICETKINRCTNKNVFLLEFLANLKFLLIICPISIVNSLLIWYLLEENPPYTTKLDSIDLRLYTYNWICWEWQFSIKIQLPIQKYVWNCYYIEGSYFFKRNAHFIFNNGNW